MKKILKIDGMGCEHCIKSVREALQEIEGLEILEVKIGEATVEIKNEELIEVIKERLDDAGYGKRYKKVRITERWNKLSGLCCKD